MPSQLEVFYREGHKGDTVPPLLFVHGAYCGGWVWETYFTPWLAERGWDCHALSLEGHGESEGHVWLSALGVDDFVRNLKATIDSCVVYDEQNIQPSQYRRYNITTAKAGDDYAAMREVLTRRYGKMTEAQANGETVKWPDAVLIDGGKGQVGMAVDVWAELGLHIPIIGIAKGPERKAGLEELILPFTGETFRLPPNSPALHLLQTVRDESHRFAITGHRKKRDKARITSSLSDIPGIGNKRRQALLIRFGGLRGVTAASVEDLAQVEGISAALAEKIYESLHG